MHRRHTALPILAAALVAGCGDADPAAPPRASSARPADAGSRSPLSQEPPAEPRFTDLPTLFEGRAPAPTAAALALMELREAAADDWPSEVLAEAAEPRLRALIRALLASDRPELPEGLAAPGFGGLTSLRPATVETLPVGPAQELRSGEPDPDRHTGPDGLAVVAAALRADFERPADVDVEVRIVSVTGVADSPTTGALVRLAERAPALRQHDLELTASWVADDPAAPLLVSLDLVSFAGTAAAAPFFRDVGPAVFTDPDTRRDELSLGVDDWLRRVDRQAGVSFQGMQGLAVGDLSGDGLDDIFVCAAVGLPNRVLVRGPDGTAVDRAADMAVDFLETTRTALVVDLDGDGHQDLVLALGASVLVAYNDGQGVYKRAGLLPGTGAEQFYVLSAADADGDGDLDLFGGRYAAAGVMHGMPTPYHDARNGTANQYWRNDGVGRFVDATEAAGLAAGGPRFTLASIWEDFDSDGDPDLYVVNDFGRNQLFENDGQGRFRDVADAAGAVDLGAGMGAAVADWDLDGDPDLYVTNMWTAAGQRIAQQAGRFQDGRHPELEGSYTKHASGNSLLANQGDGTFVDVTREAGVALGHWAWGGEFCDFDNDGFEDLYVPNGQTTAANEPFDLEAYFWRVVISRSPPGSLPTPDYRAAFEAIHHMALHGGYSWNGRERNVAYLNLGGTRFADVSVASGADYLDDSRSAAVLDWDADGRSDLLLRSRGAPRLRLLHNQIDDPGAWASFRLTGQGPNRDAIGARVVVEAGGRVLTKRLRAGSGYLCQSSKALHFGLGQAAGIERVTVEWPDGSTDAWEQLAHRQHYRLAQGAPAPIALEIAPVDLDALPSEPLEARSGLVGRVPLAHKLPLGPLALPAFDGAARTVADLAGSSVLVYVWSATHPAGEAGLAALAARRAELRAVGVTVVPLCIDEGPGLARARAVAAEQGFAETAGYADGRLRQALEVVFLEVLGAYDRVPLPSALLIDRRGNLCALYLGLPLAERVIEDAPRLRPAREVTLALSGGRWLRRPTRDWKRLARSFERNGFSELALLYAERAAEAEAEQSR